MSTVRRISVMGLAILTTIVVLAGCSSKEKNAEADVAVSTCQTDPAGGKPVADGTITNHSSKDSGYVFSITFKDPSGNRVTEGAGAVGEVKPGANATWRVQGATDAKGPLSCEINNVVRTVVP